ncbi:MAG: zinc ribbon domain-containing protein [Thermomicrobium sp.]|nr:zinc ribbon domain-containing protein [Thermomicrobium sp.]
MYCPQCGQRVSDDRDRCPLCGAVLSGDVVGTSSCPNCGAVRSPEDTYCRHCGAVLPLDLAAITGLEEEASGPRSTVPAPMLPEWLRADEPERSGQEFDWLTEAELPEWLRDPSAPAPAVAESLVQQEFVVPPVERVWAVPSVGESAEPSWFAPLPLLAVPSVHAEWRSAPPAAATESTAGQRAARLTLVVALAVLIGVVLYIVWLSR